jgi:hypothetical protein
MTRVLVVGWSSVLHGEATAADVLAMEAVDTALAETAIERDIAWSRATCPPGGLLYDELDPAGYTHVVWVCGPLHGAPLVELHERFAHAVRIAVGAAVLDRSDPAVRRFDHLLTADEDRDLQTLVNLANRPRAVIPVVGTFLSAGRDAGGHRRRQDHAADAVTRWLRSTVVGRVDLDARVDSGDWRLPATAGQVGEVVARLDAVVTLRLHGLGLALKNGVPVVAIDIVPGGGRVRAQARAWGWPVLRAEELGRTALEESLTWCLSDAGRSAAAAAAARAAAAGRSQLVDLLQAIRA